MNQQKVDGDDVLRAMLDLEYTVGPTMRSLASSLGIVSSGTALRYVRRLMDAGLVESVETKSVHRYRLTKRGRRRARSSK